MNRRPSHRRTRSPSACRRRLRGGFTLLEISVALMLAGLLFAAIANLSRNSARQKRFADAAVARHPSMQLLAEQLRHDCLSARFCATTPSEIRLVGPLSRDPQTRVATGRPAAVSYRVATVGGESALVRRETPFSAAANPAARDEVLWSGVAALEFVPLEESLQAVPADEAAPPGMRAAPSRWAVVLRGPARQTMLRLAIRHHWEDR
jgi:prepilin-type N-terminal cleavage/methylation domain-containing protein